MPIEGIGSQSRLRGRQEWQRWFRSTAWSPVNSWRRWGPLRWPGGQWALAWLVVVIASSNFTYDYTKLVLVIRISAAHCHCSAFWIALPLYEYFLLEYRFSASHEYLLDEGAGISFITVQACESCRSFFRDWAWVLLSGYDGRSIFGCLQDKWI